MASAPRPGGGGQKTAATLPAAPIAAHPRLLKKAYLLKERLESTPGLTRSALARETGMDPSQTTRLLNLTKLAPEIQSYIRGLPPTTHHPVITDRD